MHFQSADENAVRAVTQRWLLRYWHGLRCGRTLPGWTRVDARDMHSSMDCIGLYDVVADNGGRRFLIRYQGAQITRAYGGDCTGKFFDDVLPEVVRDTTLAVYRHAVQTAQPVYTISKAVDAEGSPVQHERLLLPFGEDGLRVDRIAASIEMISLARKFEQNQLMRTQPHAPVYSFAATLRVP